LAKAKNYWQPEWLANAAFVASGKAHVTFYHLFGWLTLYFDLPTVAWIGRAVGWLMLAIGLWLLTRALFPRDPACDKNYNSGLLALPIAAVWIAGLSYANLAGEWVVGGIEAKVPAYGLALAGLAMVTRGKWTPG